MSGVCQMWMKTFWSPRPWHMSLIHAKHAYKLAIASFEVAQKDTSKIDCLGSTARAHFLQTSTVDRCKASDSQ